MKLADRVSQINEPQTIAMSKKARALQAAGHDVINLSLGEPDFHTPDHIKIAAKAAIDENFTYYTPVAGIPDLKAAISTKFKTENNLDYTPEQIVVSTGAKHAIMNAFMAIINPGDEVIIPTPYWVSYSEMVKLLGGIPVFIKGTIENQFKITAQQLEKAISPKTKAFIFSSPCNPTGSVYHENELAALASIFENHPEIFIISDEIYEYIYFEDKPKSIGSFKDLINRTITINGMSKGFAMTGWRIGYLGAPTAVAIACEKIQSQYTSATSGISQKAALAALNHNKNASIEMVTAFKKRRSIVKDGLEKIPGLICNHPEGAFYFFPDISAYFGKQFNGKTIENSTDLCNYILEEHHVSFVPGTAFGDDNCIRISYASSEEKLIKACQRLEAAFSALH
jgi:aspartate aminotransferase